MEKQNQHQKISSELAGITRNGDAKGFMAKLAEMTPKKAVQALAIFAAISVAQPSFASEKQPNQTTEHSDTTNQTANVLDEVIKKTTKSLEHLPKATQDMAVNYVRLMNENLNKDQVLLVLPQVRQDLLEGWATHVQEEFSGVVQVDNELSQDLEGKKSAYDELAEYETSFMQAFHSKQERLPGIFKGITEVFKPNIHDLENGPLLLTQVRDWFQIKYEKSPDGKSIQATFNGHYKGNSMSETFNLSK